MISSSIKAKREAKGWSKKYLGDLLGVSSAAVGQYEKGSNRPKVEVLLKLNEVFNYDFINDKSLEMPTNQGGENTQNTPSLNPNDVQVNSLKMSDHERTGDFYKATHGFPINEQSVFISKVPGPGEENNLIPLGNNEYGLTVRVVPVKAYAGYVDNWGDPEYYETLAKRTLTIMGNFRGHYLAFVVKGDSMENWTSEEMAKDSIPEGSIVTGRDIQRHLWRNKLHLHRFQDYVIVHKEGIITKRITDHNTQEGYIVCHSLNPNYEDRKLMLDDCLQILNIVDVSRPR